MAYGNFQSLIDKAAGRGKAAQDTLSEGYAKALEELTGAYGEAKGVYDKMLTSEGADPNMALAGMMGLVSTGFNDVLAQLTDVQARGGFAGSPNIEGIVSSMVKGMAPQALNQYNTAESTKLGIIDKLAELAKSRGVSVAGLESKKAPEMANLMQALNTQVGGYGQKAIEEENLNARNQENLRNQLALAGIVSGEAGRKALADSVGVDASDIALKNKGGTVAPGGLAGVSGGTGLLESLTTALQQMGGGPESYAGSLYTRPGESAFDVLSRQATSNSLRSARENVASSIASATRPGLSFSRTGSRL